ncbi:uncharacterized protein LOC135497602 [Lineus longissimus]|uniref:uncharacterized protein LOC135497576 n=1 Tax=Lineus longissimus TaxID=88925 RepID=UPI00315C95F2
MYFFKFGSETMCVDATRDDGSLGRLVNDGVNGSDNCSMRMVAKEGKPYLALFASRNIGIGEELRYDYGVTDLPWRTSDKPKLPGQNDQHGTRAKNKNHQSSRSKTQMPRTPTGQHVNTVTNSSRERESEHSLENNSQNSYNGKDSSNVLEKNDNIAQSSGEVIINEQVEKIENTKGSAASESVCLLINNETHEICDVVKESNEQPSSCSDGHEPPVSVHELSCDDLEINEIEALNVHTEASAISAEQQLTDIILDAEVGAIMTQPSNGSAEPHPICLVINTTELSDIPSAEAQIPNDVRPGKDLDGSEYEMLDTNTPRDITQVDKTLLLAEEEIDIRENPKGSSTPVLTRQNRIQVDKIQSHPEPIIPLLPNEFRGNSVIQPDSAQIGEDTENTQEPRPKEYAELLPISPTIFMDQRLPISPTIFMDQRLHSDNLSLNLSESEYGMMKFENEQDTDENNHSPNESSQDSSSQENETCENTEEVRSKPYSESGELEKRNEQEGLDNQDIFRCGDCKLSFFKIDDFLQHKKSELQCKKQNSVERRNGPEPPANEKEKASTSETACSSASAGKKKTTKMKTKSTESKYPSVTVPVYQRKSDGARTYDRRHSCYFCGALDSKVSRHWGKAHKDEMEVAKIQAISDKAHKDKEKERLRHMGDFSHNIKVLQKGEGSLIVSRRPSVARNAEEYLPCIYCLAFLHQDECWRHVKTCIFNDRGKNSDASAEDNDCLLESEAEEENHTDKTTSETNRSHSMKVQCRIFLEGATRANEPLFSQDIVTLREAVISRMRHGPIKSAVEKDFMILKFGSILLNRLGRNKHYIISQRMRQLARFLIAFRDSVKKNISLTEIIDGCYFDDAVNVTKELCSVSEDTTMSGVPLLGTPSLGLHLGHSLKRCGLIKRGMGLRKKDRDIDEQSRTFLKLFNAEWTQSISTQALQSLKERRYNATEILPLTSDLLSFKNYLQQQLATSVQDLQDHQSSCSWRRLSEVLFCLVTLFNKRRGGEVAKMNLSCFVDRPKWNALANEEIVNSLSPLEVQLMKSLDMVQLPGKRNRRVPLLLKLEWVTAMDLLVRNRETCNVVNNVYFFGQPCKTNHLAPWKVLNQTAVAAGCLRPELISTTRLRKYTATVTQILGLTPGEVEWLSNHMGHTVDIHKEAYRLHESTIEMAKVSKLLLAIDQGVVGNFSGKSLDEIDIDNIPRTAFDEEDDVDWDEDDGECSEHASDSNGMVKKTKNKRRKRKNSDGEEGVDGPHADDSVAKGRPKKRKLKKKLTGIQGKPRKSNKLPPDDSPDRSPDSLPRRTARKGKKIRNIEPNSDEHNDSTMDSNYKASSSSSSSECDSGNDSMEMPRKKGKATVRGKTQRVRWTKEELTALELGFKRHLLNKRIPRQNDISRVVGNFPVLRSRTDAQIKSRVQHMIKSDSNARNALLKKSKEKMGNI